jgi:hypothetical protein
VRLVLATVLGAVVFAGLCLWRVPELLRDLRSLLGSARVRVPSAAPAES